jgi:flagellar hook protein FlgE
MVRSLNAGVSGLEQFQQEMDVIGNNIANVNTTGFKAGRVEFADAFSQTVAEPTAGSSTSASTAGIQVGSGVTTTAIQNLFTPGTIARTNQPTDLAIAGEGFFLVRDPLTSKEYLTRAGNFQLDDQKHLVTTTGLRVQGYSDPGLSTVGDLTIDTTGAPATATLDSWSIDAAGKIQLHLSDKTDFVRGQVLLQSVTAPQMLTKEGNNLYSGFASAGPLAAPAAPGSAGLGRLQGSALELSNVDLANEFAGLITTQRAFQASSRIITSTDLLLQEVVNLVR